jgi:hypothetical protein
MSSSKQIDMQRDFASDNYLSKARTPYHPPLHTVYSILIHTGKRRSEGELNQRERESGNSSQSWVENNNMAECTSSL